MMEGPKILVTDLARKKVVNKNYEGKVEVDIGFNEGNQMYSLAMCRVLVEKLARKEIKLEKYIREMNNITMRKRRRKLEEKMISKSYSKFKEIEEIGNERSGLENVNAVEWESVDVGDYKC